MTLQAYYECKLTENLEVDFGDDHQEADPHILRVGWSFDATSFQLGRQPRLLNNQIIIE